MDELIDLLRAARILARLTQDELGNAAGLSRQIIARLENHQQNVSIGAINSVKTALKQKGVIFIPSKESRGPGIAMQRGGTKERRHRTLATSIEETNNDHEPSEE